MATFRGSFQHSIDHKGRISIPARFRRLLSTDASETFVILRGFESCVSLYPLDEWGRYEERLRQQSFEDPLRRQYVRLLATDLNDATLDAQGRVVIPPRLLEHARLERDATVLGVIDHIEIWDPTTFDEYMKRTNKSYEELAGELLR
jgi:transcriptional regulator MraZ